MAEFDGKLCLVKKTCQNTAANSGFGDSHLFPCRYVFGKFNFGKVSFANGFEEPVLSDVRLLAGPPS